MKNLVLLLMLMNYQIGLTQDDEPIKKDKPSWGQDMPERQTAPKMKLGVDFDDDDDDEEEDFGLNRGGLGAVDAPVVDDLAAQEKQQELEKQAELDKIAADEIQADLDKIAAKEKQSNLDRIDAEEQQSNFDKTADQEKQRQAELDNVAAQEKQAELDKIAAQEKQIERDKIAEQQKQNQMNAQEQQEASADIIEEVVVNSTDPVIDLVYKWKKIKHIAPKYPSRATRGNIEGWVEVELTINNQGTVISADIIKSYKKKRVFNSSALAAVNQWVYDPPSNYGILTNQSKIVKIIFKL